eukprot:Skav209019  [mRNA]  locus=scaffold2629:87204:100098:+ [translate_table: standard]
MSPAAVTARHWQAQKWRGWSCNSRAESAVSSWARQRIGFYSFGKLFGWQIHLALLLSIVLWPMSFWPRSNLCSQAIVKALKLNSSLTFVNPEYTTFIEKEDSKAVMEALRRNAYSKARLPFDAPVLRPVERSKQERGDNFEVVDFQPFQKDQEAAEKYPDEHGSPGICGAAIDGKVAAVRGFVRRDANAVNLRDRYGPAPQRNHSTVVRVLLAAKASMEAKDDHGNRPLHLAARWGYMEILQLLIAANASLEAKGNGRGPQTGG